MGFVSLHNHTWASNMRFLDSINRPEELIDKALSLGFSGIAFTDHESVSAAVAVLNKRDEIEKDNPDFKIIFGNEIYLIDESELRKTDKFYHFILLAKDEVGWMQLKTLSSQAWERSYTHKGQRRVPTTYQDIERVVGADPGHLLASSACIGGFMGTKILEHDPPAANQFIQWCIKVFGKDNFALELQPAEYEEQVQVNKILLGFAEYYDLTYIITTDSHYLNKEDFTVHSIYLNSKKAKDRETDKFYRYTYMMDMEEMQRILLAGGLTQEQFERGIENTERFTKDVQKYEFRHDTIVPKIKIPPFQLSRSLYPKGDEYEYIKKYYESPDEQDRYLMYQIEQGMALKDISPGDPVYLSRINEELDILWFISERLNEKLSAYFNLTKRSVEISWKVSLCGPGRGSACGELINYLIGITQINPLEYNLLHWRFLNKERVELPRPQSLLGSIKIVNALLERCA